MIGYIKYVTRKPIGKKPYVFLTGGYSGTTKDGKESSLIGVKPMDTLL